MKRVLKLSNVVVVGRLRKDAALRGLPPKIKPGQRRGRGRPRKYGKNKISLAKRAGQKRGWQTVECMTYGQTVKKTYKTFQTVFPAFFRMGTTHSTNRAASWSLVANRQWRHGGIVAMVCLRT